MSIFVITGIDQDNGELVTLTARYDRRDATDTMVRYAIETLEEEGICDTEDISDMGDLSLALEDIGGYVNDNYCHFGNASTIQYEINECEIC